LDNQNREGMRVVTPTTASGASCVLGLQRAWAQPRRTDSSTCSATSSQLLRKKLGREGKKMQTKKRRKKEMLGDKLVP
jgi:hypothetical protein